MAHIFSSCMLTRSFSPELEVLFWHHGAYLDPNTDGGPPFFIPLKWIMSQACRLAIKVPKARNGNGDDADGRPRELVWATSGLTKVRSSIRLGAESLRHIKRMLL